MIKKLKNNDFVMSFQGDSVDAGGSWMVSLTFES